MLDRLNRRPRNSILRNLSAADFSCIRPFLNSVVLKERTVLQEARKRVEHLYFIETGIVSLRTLGAGSILETATVGYQGVVGVSVALGTETSMHQSIVLVSGTALRIHIDDLLRSMRRQPQIREHLLRYTHALLIHSSQTALCCAKHDIEERLACWLCLACDALDGNVLPITHDHLSVILGLRRAGVTESLTRFEQAGLIRKMRGLLQIRDRQLLEQKACSCYGIVARGYYSAKLELCGDNPST